MNPKKTTRVAPLFVSLLMVFGLLVAPLVTTAHAEETQREAGAATEQAAQVVEEIESQQEDVERDISPDGEETPVEPSEQEEEPAVEPEPELEPEPGTEAPADTSTGEEQSAGPDDELTADDNPTEEEIVDVDTEDTELEEATDEAKDGMDEEESATEAEAAPFASLDLRDLFRQSGNYPNEAGWTIMDRFNLAFYDADGNETGTPTINSSVFVSLGFTLPEDIRLMMGGGEYYTVQMPEQLRLSSPIDMELVHGGSVVAHVNITTEGTVTITFTQAVTRLANISCAIEFYGGLNAGGITGPGTVVILVPGEEHLDPIEVEIRPETGNMIDKSGVFTKSVNPDGMVWTVDINKALETLTGVVVTESFPAGTTLQNVEVYTLALDLNGDEAEDGMVLVDPATYSVDEAGTVWLGSIEGAYRILYTCAIDDEAMPSAGGTVTFTNTATVNANELDGAEEENLRATASLSAQYSQAIDKSLQSYDNLTQTVNWRIQYNYNERSLQSPVLYDTFDTAAMEYLPESMVISRVTVNNDGSATHEVDLVSGEDYTVVQTADGFEIHFDGMVDYAVQISYSTRVLGILTANGTYTNTVTDGNVTDYAGVNLRQQNLNKDVVSVDYNEKSITWRVRVNYNNYTLNNWVMEDTWTDRGLTYNGDITVYDRNGGHTLGEEAGEYLFTPQENGFRLALAGGYASTTSSFDITYSTTYNAMEMGDYVTFINTANAAWSDENGSYTGTGTARVSMDDRELNNGGKSGSYNAVTKEITWSVFVDYSRNGVRGAVLQDPIQDGQAYVPGSLVAYSYTVQPNGKQVRGEPVSLTGFVVEEPSEDNGNTLTVTLPDGAGQYWFEFRTSLEGTLIQKEYHNTATFTNGSTGQHILPASVSVYNGGSFIGKDGAVGTDGYFWWHIDVNTSQSTMHDVLVVDIPSANQLIVMNTLLVVGATVDADGTIGPNYSDILVQGEDYTAAYQQNEDGLWELQVEFPGVISSPYVIEYRVKILVQNGGAATISNRVSIYGMNEVEVDDGENPEYTIDVSGGAGVVIGEPGGFTLRKVDAETGEGLSGARFQLYDEDGVPLGGETVSDVDGYVTYGNLILGEYTLVETAAPDGYTIADELREGVSILVNQASTAEGVDYVFSNSPTQIQLQKQDDEGQPLAGALFILEVWDMESDEWTQVELEQLPLTDEEGSLALAGLPLGRYRFTEIEAPEGYQLNNEPVEFELTDREGVVQVGPFVNYPLEIVPPDPVPDPDPNPNPTPDPGPDPVPSSSSVSSSTSSPAAASSSTSAGGSTTSSGVLGSSTSNSVAGSSSRSVSIRTAARQGTASVRNYTAAGGTGTGSSSSGVSRQAASPSAVQTASGYAQTGDGATWWPWVATALGATALLLLALLRRRRKN